MVKQPTDDSLAADAVAFRAAVRDVKPLAQTAKPAGLTPVKPRRRKRVAEAGADLAETMPLILPDADAVLIAGDAQASFHRSGVRTQVMRRLRRGLIPVESELDLHGLTQSAARDQLAQFLSAARAAGMRCVRVIHGKGYRSGARGPVLKVAVDLWLRRHAEVLAFSSAKPLDGGSGAKYVLLRA